MADHGLAADIDEVLAAWSREADQGLMSTQSADKFALLARRFARYAAASGSACLREVDRRVAEGFITAHGRTRHGHVAESAVAIWHLRRTVLRTLFRTARTLGLADADPTMDLKLPPRTNLTTRPLTDDEASLVRHFAESRAQRTRHPAVVALADAGAHSGEIGHLSVADLDLDRSRVWVHGSSKTDPRWCPLDPWQATVLSQRAGQLRAHRPASADPHLPLATSGRGSDAQLQARVCVALGNVLTWSGLAGEPDIRPASIAAHCGAALFDATGRIEAVAQRLGLRSLDRAAALIGYDWAGAAEQGPDSDRGR